MRLYGGVHLMARCLILLHQQSHSWGGLNNGTTIEAEHCPTEQNIPTPIPDALCSHLSIPAWNILYSYFHLSSPAVYLSKLLLKLPLGLTLTIWLLSPLHSSTTLYENQFLPIFLTPELFKLEPVIYGSTLVIDHKNFAYVSSVITPIPLKDLSDSLLSYISLRKANLTASI